MLVSCKEVKMTVIYSGYEPLPDEIMKLYSQTGVEQTHQEIGNLRFFACDMYDEAE